VKKTLSYLFVINIFLALLSSCNPEKPTVNYQQINDNWKLQQVGNDLLREAEVPGCVHMDLYYNGVIEDPFYRDHEEKLQWIEEEEWVYSSTFDVKEEILEADNIELAFEGIDTYADVYLNDKLLFSADNMFRNWIIECKDYLQVADNILKVHFYSSVQADQQKAENVPYALPDIRGFTRKAPYQYGWDWGPRFVTSGIWRPVALLSWNQFMIDNIQIIQKELTSESAHLSASITIESIEKQLVEVSIQDKSSGFELVNNPITLAQGTNIVNFQFQIDNPQLWWPNGWGEPHLYILECIIRAGDYIDSESVNIGLRTISLIQDEDEHGTSFHFEVNGEPLFAKGANYIPQESFVPRLRKGNYESVINAAKMAHMNMLRVWGGGIYEEDVFYDLCDESGILVWQDFMFACNMYPGDEGFLKSVRQEAIDNVIRLRNHPCIAIWCGNNEIDEGWKNWGWQEQLGYSYDDSVEVWTNYVKLFHEILPEVVNDYDPARPYWPSSPSMGWGHGAAYHSGDVHYWGVWWGEEPFQKYEEKVGRFMSEYGFQGMPDLRTIDQFTLPADRETGSPVMESHQKHPRGTKLIDTYMERDYQKPESFEDYVYVSQLVQAEGIRTALEAHRRAKPYCMGTLYWQLNDCWPVTSWSSIDYYGRWKALHYFTKKAFEPLMLSCSSDQLMKFFVINDTLDSYNAIFEIVLQDFEGKVLWDLQKEIEIQPNSNHQVHAINQTELLDGLNHKQLLMVLQLIENDRVITRNIKYFVPVKDLVLPEPDIQYSIDSVAGGSRITLWTKKLAKNVFLSSPDSDGFFSNNYFDLLPDDTASVDYSGKYSTEELNYNLTVKSLYTVTDNETTEYGKTDY